MEKTLMGIIEVDPKKLLQDGIRKVWACHCWGAVEGGARTDIWRVGSGGVVVLLSIDCMQLGGRAALQVRWR